MTNLVEILRNAPKGLELYSPVYGKVKLETVNEKIHKIYKIAVTVIDDKMGWGTLWFDECGRVDPDNDCCLFPSKECKNWNEWQFTLLKPGHFITAIGLTFYIKSKLNCDFKAVDKNGTIGKLNSITPFRFASTEEIEHFYVELRKNGYTIKNGELKPAEKCEIYLDTSTFVTETKEPRLINSKPFTIDDFKPFDKVLGFTCDGWEINLFSNYAENNTFSYICLTDCYRNCIPYNDETKYLLGTTKEYNGKYKTW